MIHTDPTFSDAVARKVAAIEKATDAEVVVVAARCSGSYRDTALTAASVASFATFAVLVLIPYTVSPLLVLADLLGVWAAVGWWVTRSPWSARLSGATRRQRQVRSAAAAEFQLESVHSTPRRVGLLVYLSSWEGLVELVPDVGVDARVPRGEWPRVSGTDLNQFLAGLDALGAVLAARLPATDEGQLELADAPRIR